MKHLSNRALLISIIIIILIIITVVIVILTVWKNNFEFFVSNNIQKSKQKTKLKSKLKIAFLNPSQGSRIMGDSRYFSEFKELDFVSRGCVDSESCMAKYKNNILNITENEKKAVTWLTDNMYKQMCEAMLPKIQNTINEVKFIKVSSRIEGNMPHTRSDCVVFPAYWYEELINFHRNSELDYAIKEYGGTLIHELFHIIQRKYPTIMIDFYETSLYFVKAEDIEMINPIRNRVRLNPDGVEMMWVWDHPEQAHPIWVNAIYANEGAKKVNNLKQVKYMAVKLERKGNRRYQVVKINNRTIMEPINENQPFISFFQLSHNNYHPNEITAEYFRFHVLYLLGKYDNQNVLNSKGMTHFRKFLNKFN